MVGLIKKDLLMIKGNLKFITILLVVYTLMAFQKEMDLIFLIPFLSVVLMMSTFSYDSYNKWDAYVITLPNGRKNSVKSKYLATLLIIIIASIVVTLLSFIIDYKHTKLVDYENILMMVAGCISATIILQSFMYPAIYKFGIEKARIGVFVIVFGIAIIGSFVINTTNLSLLDNVFKLIFNYWMIILPIVIFSILFISYKISEKIYLNKEF